MISQQAFSKARNNFDHSPFETMVRTLVEKEYSGELPLPTWNGYHVLAVDGSYLQLPKTEELRETFGVRGEGGRCVSAGISVLYDVLHGWPIDPSITHSDMNERNECVMHLRYLKEKLPNIASKSLILMDRGYPSIDLLKSLKEKGIKYLIRCASNYCKKTQGAPMGDSVIELEYGLSARVFKFELPSGETETLLTDLFDIPSEKLPELYAMRWGIEVAYDRLKNLVCLENFSGCTANAIRQDFWTSMVLMISVAVFQKVADKKIAKEQLRKPNKLTYRANTGTLVVTLRDEFVFSVLSGNGLLSSFRLRKIIKLITYSKSPVRPDRSFYRNMNGNSSFNLNRKSHL